MEFDEETVDLYEGIISELSPPDGNPLSSASLEQELDFDSIGNGISELIRFGVLEFVNTSGSNMHVRVRLRKPVPIESEQVTLTDLQDDTVWLAYIGFENKSRPENTEKASS